MENNEAYKAMLEKHQNLVHVDKHNLSREMERAPSQVYWAGTAKADAERAMDRAKAKLELTKSKIDKKVRSSSAGKRKPSEKEIENRITRHPEVIAATEAYFEAKWKHNVAWALVSALSAKVDQLANLAYNYRKELDAGITRKVKRQSADEKVKDVDKDTIRNRKKGRK